MGLIYLIHFSRPLHHARHYLGYTDSEDISTRLARHRSGSGAKILAHLNSIGIEYEVVRTFSGDRALERRMKVAHKSATLCPLCREERLAKLREQKREWRAARKSTASVSIALTLP